MNTLWSLTIDDYLEIYERAKKNGKQPGDSMEDEIIQYVKEKNIKPIGHTELTKKELIEKQGWKLIDETLNKRIRASDLLKKLPNQSFNELKDISQQLRGVKL